MARQIICALDTSDVDEAVGMIRKLSPHVGAFKIGHALTLAEGLSVVGRLQDAGAHRIFLDLKFHDIPNSVALAVREASRRGVWMMTIHLSGGPAMITAAVEETRNYSVTDRPLLVGVSVLTSLDQRILTEDLGVQRTVLEQMVALSKLGMDLEMDGIVCSPQEISELRHAVGRGIIVTPGIRLPSMGSDDQKRTGDALTAVKDGADYLVVGRALTHAPDPEAALAGLGVLTA